MRYLLDTNVAVDFFTGRFPSVAERLLSLPPDQLVLSAIAVAELRFGADKSARSDENHDRIDRFLEDVATLDFDASAARSYGRLRLELERAGTLVGPDDMLIAAQALSNRLTVVTDNEGEFGKVSGLAVENWRE